jgi:cbb3-type cytochrome oxidase cytochrome c subunit
MRKATLTAGILFIFMAPFLGGCTGRGRAVFVREGCVNCHRFRELGGGLAPDLSEVGSRRDAASLRAKITGTGATDPASRMPAFTRLSWLDLRSLVAFLRS